VKNEKNGVLPEDWVFFYGDAGKLRRKENHRGSELQGRLLSYEVLLGAAVAATVKRV